MNSTLVRPRRDIRPAAVCFCAGLLLALGSSLPGPLRWAAGLACLVIPGWSLLAVAFARHLRADRSSSLLLSIVLSMVIDAFAVIAINVVGLKITMTSIAIALLVFQCACGGLLYSRSATLDERTPIDQASEAVEGDGEEWTPAVLRIPNRRRGAHATIDRAGQRSASRTIRQAIMVAGAMAAVIGVIAIVHDTAPSPANPAYAWITFDHPASIDKVVAVQPGPQLVPVVVHSHGVPAGGPYSVMASLDGQVVAGPEPVSLASGRDEEITLAPALPALDGCVHRIDITLLGTSASASRSLTRYVTGAGAHGCQSGK